MLKNAGENTRVIVDAGIYDIEAEYLNYYGENFFADYPNQGYHSKPQDKFYAGLWLADGVELIGNGNVLLTFPYKGGTRLSEIDHSDPMFDPVAQYFSIINTTQNNVVEGIDIELSYNNCRYHIHDDFATKEGINVFRNMQLKGTSQKRTAFGCGMGRNNVYIIENCTITCEGGYSISYHNNRLSGKNYIMVKDIYCDGNIMARMYGDSVEKSAFIVSGCRANAIICDYVDKANFPNDNIDLVLWNNKTIK